MFKVVTANVNGIRAAAKKGFFDWLLSTNPDVVCLQEIKAQEEQLLDAVFYPQGYQAYFCSADKKGYSGVALYCKQKPDAIHQGLGWACADTEGRYLQADFGELSVASLYLPSGSSKDVRQDFKDEFLIQYLPILEQQLQSGRSFIICGDWNIAHRPIDIKNWKSNRKSSGFLPHERAWLDSLFELGFVDAFRVLNQEPEYYTWWSERTRAWDKNIGWRIDYQITTPNLRDKIRTVAIYRDEKFSDHAPVIVEYDL